MPNASCTNVQEFRIKAECQMQAAQMCRKFSIILNAKCRPYKLQYGVVSAPPFQSLQLIAEARVCSPFSIKSGYNDQMFQEHQSDVCATKNQNFSNLTCVPPKIKTSPWLVGQVLMFGGTHVRLEKV